MLSFRSGLWVFGAVWTMLFLRAQLLETWLAYLAYLMIAPWCAAIFVAGAAFLWQVVHYRFFHSLRKFPGPFWAGVTRLWLAKVNVKGMEHEELLRLHERYGRLYHG
jgi:hypothetical protein